MEPSWATLKEEGEEGLLKEGSSFILSYISLLIPPLRRKKEFLSKINFVKNFIKALLCYEALSSFVWYGKIKVKLWTTSMLPKVLGREDKKGESPSSLPTPSRLGKRDVG